MGRWETLAQYLLAGSLPVRGPLQSGRRHFAALDGDDGRDVAARGDRGRSDRGSRRSGGAVGADFDWRRRRVPAARRADSCGRRGRAPDPEPAHLPLAAFTVTALATCRLGPHRRWWRALLRRAAAVVCAERTT